MKKRMKIGPMKIRMKIGYDGMYCVDMLSGNELETHYGLEWVQALEFFYSEKVVCGRVHAITHYGA